MLEPKKKMYDKSGPRVAAALHKRNMEGKKISQSYVRIEDIGAVKCCGYQIGQEVPLEELATE